MLLFVVSLYLCIYVPEPHKTILILKYKQSDSINLLKCSLTCYIMRRGDRSCVTIYLHQHLKHDLRPDKYLKTLAVWCMYVLVKSLYVTSPYVNKRFLLQCFA